MYRWIGFGLGSIVLTAVSWKSLRRPGAHGFHRFFAWESILALFLINVTYWFHDPFSWNQLIAWTLLVLSLIPLFLGIHDLRMHGRPADQRQGDPSLLTFEKTTRLVTEGIYHYIRHPLYSSLLLLTWGIFFKAPGIVALLPALMSSFFLWRTAKADEAECIHFFGQDYAEYMERTKRFVPYLF